LRKGAISENQESLEFGEKGGEKILLRNRKRWKLERTKGDRVYHSNASRFLRYGKGRKGSRRIINWGRRVFVPGKGAGINTILVKMKNSYRPILARKEEESIMHSIERSS